MPPKFFITHSSKDNEFALRLCDDLRRHGLDGFLDVYSVKPGDMIPEEINRGLEACDLYVLILSFVSLQSPWCKEEIDAAIMLSNKPGRNGRPRIIPVLIEKCQDAMPALLQTRLYVNFAGRYDQALNELLKAFALPEETTEKAQAPIETDESVPSGILALRKIREEDDRLIANLREAGARVMEHAEKYYEHGREYYSKGEFAEAIYCYSMAIIAAPKYGQAFYQRGLAHRAIGERTKAVADFESYLRLKPDASNRAEIEEWIRVLKESKDVSTRTQEKDK